MKHLLFIFCIFLMFLNRVGVAQSNLTTKSEKAAKFFNAAVVEYNARNYSKAIEYLDKAINDDDQFVEAYLLLGESNIDLQNDSLAMEYFKKAIAINPDFYPPVFSNLAGLEFNKGMYSEALAHIEKYLTYPSKNKTFQENASLLKQNCEFAINAVKHPVPFDPQNLGPAINNQYDQYWPSLSADEKTLVFTELLPIDPNNPATFRNRQEDFYYSTLEDSVWTPAKPVGPPLNTSGNEGAQSISADRTLMVFTGCNRSDGYGQCDLYFSRKNGDNWTVPRNIGKPINTTHKEKQPSISPDGKSIYFASDREGTKGGMDIWVSTLTDDGVWGEPLNLGDSINTREDEESPFIHNDNQTLYFSSAGWPGMGSFDLYVSRKDEHGKWTKAKNLGYPINTGYAEEGLIVNARGNKAYYSSSRNGEGGKDLFVFDLYKEVRPIPVSYMKGRVFDKETLKPLEAQFSLTDLETSVVVMDAVSNPDGSFLICIPEGKNYALNASRKGYLFYSENFTLQHGNFLKPFTKDVPLKPIKENEHFILKNVFFATASYELKPESQIELNLLVKLLNENPGMTIEISGHTDDVGSAESNQKLSENRALAVKNYLVAKGIAPERLESAGYGETQSVVPNSSETNRAQNRRTEIKVLKQ